MRSIDACSGGEWHLHTWPRDEDHGEGHCKRQAFTCRSWRHAGECRQWRGALDWWRVKQALDSRDDWVYIVLTFALGDTEEKRFKTYYLAGKCWDLLRKKLNWRYDAIAYIQTWERHKKGGCHCNLVIGNPQICYQVEQDWKSWRRNILIPLAVSSGFGKIAWVERCDKAEGRLAGYLTKLANELTDSSTKNQVPVDAPPHFRRIRASRGLLPKKPDPELTGQLVRVPLPEYNSRIPESSNPCGAVGKPVKTLGERNHETVAKFVGSND